MLPLCRKCARKNESQRSAGQNSMGRLLINTAQDFRDTAQALFDGHLGPLDWIEERSLSSGFEAFEDLRKGTVAAPKIVLHPWA